MEVIESYASLLDLPASGIVKLARDISNNPRLESVHQLSEADKLELYLFLHRAAIVEGKLEQRMRA